MKLKSILGYASGSAIGAVLSFLTLPALAWLFSQEDVGKIVMLQVACSLFAVVFSLGLDQSYVREFNDDNNKASLAKNCLVPGLIFLSIVSTLIMLFHSKIGSYIFGLDNFYFISVGVICFFILYFERFLSVFVRMEEMVLAFSITKILPKLLFLLLILLVYFYSDLQNLNYLLLTQAFSWFLAVLVMAFYLRKILYDAIFAPLSIEKQKKIMRFGLPLVVNGLVFWALTYIDRLMIAHYSSFSQLGLYAMASGFAGVAVLLKQIFSTIWHPTIYRWVAEGIKLERVSAISDALQLVSFILITIIGCLSWLLPYFLPVEYADIQYLIVACLIQPFLLMLSEVSGIGISIMRKTAYLPLITSVSLIFNVVLNVLLIPEYGAAGAASATAASTALYIVLKTELSTRLWHPINKTRLYIGVITITFFSVLHCLNILNNSSLYIVIWLFLAITFMGIYRNSIPAIKLLISTGR